MANTILPIDFRGLAKYVACAPQAPLPLSIFVALNCIPQIASAVQYLHTRTPPIAHRDIKLANVLVDKGGNAKVGI